MKVLENALEGFAHIDHLRRSGASIGLIPTMGALHAGHISLVSRSVRECDATVATIFVNPAQFGPNEDLARYPRTLERDLESLNQAGCDLVFVPAPDVMYPPGFSTYIQPPAVAEPLEGVCRPGHFRGVVTVVLKLFQILPATVAYFGQKDYQQWQVIRQMVNDLNVPIRIVGCPTERESDGLAMSSRNRYLSPAERQVAVSLSRALNRVQRLVKEGQLGVAGLEAAVVEELTDGGVDRIDYARIVEQETLASLVTVDRPAVALIAAHVGTTRLIDNLLLD